VQEPRERLPAIALVGQRGLGLLDVLRETVRAQLAQQFLFARIPQVERATAEIGAPGSAMNTARADRRISSSLRAAWARRPLSGADVSVINPRLALEQIIPFWYCGNRTFHSVPDLRRTM
jgi:hypothetical protein